MSREPAPIEIVAIFLPVLLAGVLAAVVLVTRLPRRVTAPPMPRSPAAAVPGDSRSYGEVGATSGGVGVRLNDGVGVNLYTGELEVMP